MQKKNVKKEIIRYTLLFIITFISLLAFLHFFRFPDVNGDSMNPNYYHGDTVLTLYTKNIKLNDVVVTWNTEISKYIIKRVIGMPGDHIEIKNGHVYRNNMELYELYINEQNWFSPEDYVDIVVPDNEMFLLGDNRKESTDSRDFGTIPIEDVFGVVLKKIE